MEESEEAVILGINTLRGATTFGEISLSHKLHNLSLPLSGNRYQVVLGALNRQKQCRTLPSFSGFIKSEDVGETLGGFLTGVFYAWKSCAWHEMRPSGGPTLAFFTDPRNFVRAHVERSAENVVKFLVDDDVT